MAWLKTRMTILSFISLILMTSRVQATWPNCIETGNDYTALDIISGYRFSNEGCSNWCKDIASCIRWVFKEEGSQCFIKAENGVAKPVNATSNGLLIYSGTQNCSSTDPGETRAT